MIRTFFPSRAERLESPARGESFGIQPVKVWWWICGSEVLPFLLVKTFATVPSTVACWAASVSEITVAVCASIGPEDQPARRTMTKTERQSTFIAQRYYYQMRTLFVALIMLVAFTASADDLEALKVAATRYVASMKAVLALPEAADCSETIAKAGQYAAAKRAYYDAARQAMPTLLQNAKGPKSDSTYGDELAETFRDFGEDRDEEVTGALEAKLNECPASDHRDQARLAVEHAKRTAEQFIKDFSRLEGV